MLYQISDMSIKISYMPYEKFYLSTKSGLKPEFCCQAPVRELYNLPCTKTWPHARVLMSVYCQTVVQFSMHQRPGSRQGFDVRHLSDSCIILMHQRPGLKPPS